MNEGVSKGLDLLGELEQKGDDAIKSTLIDLYEEFSGENLRKTFIDNILNKPKDESESEETTVSVTALGVSVESLVADFLLKQNPTYPAIVALMIEDFIETAFMKLSKNREMWERTQNLLKSEKQVALTALLDLLVPIIGLPPAITVSALLIKLGVKSALGIGPDGPSFDNSFIGKKINTIFKNIKYDHFWLNYAAAKLHKRKNYIKSCQKRLSRCESICRERNDFENLNHVGYEYIEIGEIDKGMELAEEALKNLPEHPGIIDSVSWAYFKIGRIKKAYKLILKALKKEKEVIEKYGEEGWLEMLYHSVLIFKASNDLKNENKYYGILENIDKNKQWLSKIIQQPLRT